MRPALATGCLIACVVVFAPGAEAKVLERGAVIDRRPTTVAASVVVLEPRRLAFDVRAPSGEPVRVEWFLLCPDRPPVTGGERVIERPLHRNLKLRPHPKGICIFEVMAFYADQSMSGRLSVTLRGRAKKPPVPLAEAG
jgi:hypothetical protein